MAGDRYKDVKFVGWLKVNLSLIFAKEGVEQFSDDEVQIFHDNIKRNIPSSSARGLHTCIDNTQSRQDNKRKLTQEWQKGRFSCQADHCHLWLGGIRKEYLGSPRSVEWDNCNLAQLSTDPWACAKLYMPYGSASFTKASDVDIASLFTLFLRCDHFRKFFNQVDVCQKVKDIRNRMMHISKMEVDAASVTAYTTQIIEFLEDPKHLLHQPPCQEAVRKIKELLSGKTEISLNRELEQRVPNTKLHNLVDLVDALRTKAQDTGADVASNSEDIKKLKSEQQLLKTVLALIAQQTDQAGDIQDKKPAHATSDCSSKPEPTSFPELGSPHFDGRLIKVEAERMEKLCISGERLKEGAFGETFTSNINIETKTQKMLKKMVIKRISCKDKDDFLHTALREKLASRIKHQFIVPVLVFSEDKDSGKFYFMMPYMENGNLRDAIEDQTYMIMRVPIRLRIMLQLAAVLEYLHKPVEKFRGPYVHGDISSNNIVLDQKYNIRLLDFGMSKEVKCRRVGTTMTPSNMDGTLGYTPPNVKPTPQRDCWGWAAIALELITGVKAEGRNGKWLMYEENIKNIPTYQRKIKNIWADKKDSVDRILGLVERCKENEQVPKEEVSKGGAKTRAKEQEQEPVINIKADEIVEQMKDIIKGPGDGNYEKLPENENCLICLVNRKVKGNIMDHRCKAGDKVEVEICVACLRNSYLNPVQCPACLQELCSPIGTEMGAVLIAGNDMNDETCKKAEAFINDVENVYKAVTSKQHLVMGIREENVKRVYLNTPGKKGTLMKSLEDAFNGLHVNTLLLYFTGHARKSDNRLELGHDKETISEKEVINIMRMKEVLFSIRKLIVFLDCCYAPTGVPKITEPITLLKLTACRSDEEAVAYEKKGSDFTNLLLQCLSGNITKCAFCKMDEGCAIYRELKLDEKCSDGFISMDCITEYIGKHTDTYQHPKQDVVDAGWQDTKLAYYVPNIPKMKFQFDFGTPCSFKFLPDNIMKLKEDLYKMFKGSPVRIKHFLDVYAIVIQTDHKSDHQLEQCELAQIESAWNGHSELHVLPRHIKNIDHGKVGFFLEEQHSPATISPATIMRIVSEDNEEARHTTDKDVIVRVPLQKLDTIRICPPPWISKLKDEELDALEECHAYLDDKVLEYMENGYENQGKAEKDLVFTFEYEDSENSAERALEKFFSVHLDIPVNEAGHNDPDVTSSNPASH